jgi:hypothetical protein
VWDWTLLQLLLFILIYGVLAFSLGANVQKNMVRNPSHLWLRQVEHLEKQIPDRINYYDVLHHGNSIEILGDYVLGEYKNSDSMLPLLDYGVTGIYVMLEDNTPLYLGDVISFTSENYSISHRIIGIEQDEQGLKYITKGDNNLNQDPFALRRENITAVMVGVLW